MKPDQWLAAANSVHGAINEILMTTLANDLKIRELSKEINLKTLQNEPIATSQTSMFAVMVPVESDVASKLKIELSYQIPRATWKPIYDARLSTEGKGSLELTQYGVVNQATGEDWTGVELKLSTAQPQRGTRLPDLSPMWLDAYETRGAGGSAMPIPIGRPNDDSLSIPPAQKAEAGDPLQEWRSKSEARRLSLESESAPPEPEKAVAFTPAVLETGGFMSEYKITGPSTVLADGTETKLLVGAFDTDSKIQVHVRPQVSTEAYLIAHATLKGEAPVLPGQLNLFRDGAFTGQAFLPMLRPGEDREISFGVDDQVSVKRKTLKNETKEEGLISKDNVVSRQYVTEIQNLHAEPVNIVLREMVPTSRNEKAVVFLRKDVTSPGFVADAKNIKGMLHWNFDLKPKEKKEMKVSWTVTWPKDHRLTGL